LPDILTHPIFKTKNHNFDAKRGMLSCTELRENP